jgi:putative membrane protein
MNLDTIGSAFSAAAIALVSFAAPATISAQHEQHGGTTASTSKGTPSEQTSSGTKGTMSVPTFVTEVGQGGQAEVSLGKLATQHAKSADVKQFAERMVTDHGQANQELAALASRKGWSVPTEPGPKHKAEEQRLSRLTGEQFDRSYMQAMLKDHEKDVREFEQASKQLTDPDLKAWAEKTLPTLREHLARARAVSTSMGDSKKATSQP